MPAITYTDPHAAPENPRQNNSIPARQRSSAGDRIEATPDDTGSQGRPPQPAPAAPGSIQDVSRLTETGARISSRSETASEIRDAAAAAETAGRVRSEILQNPSQAAVVHALSSPQQVLAVLNI